MDRQPTGKLPDGRTGDGLKPERREKRRRSTADARNWAGELESGGHYRPPSDPSITATPKGDQRLLIYRYDLNTKVPNFSRVQVAL